MKQRNSIILVCLLLLLYSCSNTDNEIIEQQSSDNIEEINDEESNAENNSTQNTNPNPIGSSAGDVEFYNEELVEDNYILVNDAGNDFVYLMDKKGNVIYQWNLNGGDLGNDCFLLEDGQLLTMVESDNQEIILGGSGGKIQLLDYDGNENWSYVYSTSDFIAHHDAEMLPNGNILVMTWNRYSQDEAINNGYILEVELFVDGIIEINPSTNEIVWEWQAWNHLIQDFDNTKYNFGVVGNNPQLIDINYNQREDGDITHANGIAYDEAKDIIYLSANFYSEVWVIDHSTTTIEAASNNGGNYNKGGNLIYRFGNPTAYQNNNGDRLFNNNHYPNLIEENKMLIFSNGAQLLQSTVYELQLPETFDLNIDSNNEPLINWTFTKPNLYSPRVSGAVRLLNGNTLITEGDAGIWEVTNEGEVVWKFLGDGFYWRAYSFDKNATEILDINL